MSQILVIEDSPSLNQVMVLALRSEGYSVASATGCDEALDRLTPDCELILLDLMMPGMDGLTCLTGVLERGFHGKVIVVSGSNEGREMANVVGADGYLAKPFSPDDLIETVRSYISPQHAAV